MPDTTQFNDVSIAEQLGRPEDKGIFPKRFVDNVIVDDSNIAVMKRDIRNSFTLGDATNGVLGTAIGIGGKQIVLGKDDRDLVVNSITNSNKLFTENFRFNYFKDSRTNATWDNTAHTLTFTPSQIAQSLSIALNDGVINSAIITLDSATNLNLYLTPNGDYSDTLAHYKLNGDSSDFSSNGYTGTDTSMSYVSGLEGQAGSFNGTTSKIDIAVVSNNIQSFCVAYNRSASFVSNEAIIVSNGGSGGISWFKQATNDWQLIIANSSTSKVYRFRNITPLTDGAWHHEVLIFHSDTNLLDWYRDGALLSSSIASDYNSALGTITSHTIGKYSAGWNGLMYDIRIYERILASNEILSIYNWGIGNENFPWKSASNGTLAPFPLSGSDLRWKLIATGSATVSKIIISYS